MPKFNKENAVLTQGVFLPEFLFYSEDVKSSSITPVASLNPATATDGNAFPSSTFPSAGKKKRTLIIDRNSFDEDLEYGEQIALLKRLQIAGFEIFLRSAASKENPNIFHRLDADLRNVTELRNLSTFNPKSDYSELAKQTATDPEKSCLLGEQKGSQSHIKDVIQALNQNAKSGRFLRNSWQVELRVEPKYLQNLGANPAAVRNPVFGNLDFDNAEDFSDKKEEKDEKGDLEEEYREERMPLGFPSKGNYAEELGRFYEKVAFILQQANKNQKAWVIEAMSRELLQIRLSEESGQESEFRNQFANGALLILKANPDQSKILLKTFELLYHKLNVMVDRTSCRSFEEFLFEDQQFESFDKFLSATEFFPNRENLSEDFVQFLEFSDLEKFSELIEKFPQEKSSLKEALTTSNFSPSSPNFLAASILNNIYHSDSSLDYDPFAGDFQEFEELTKSALSKYSRGSGNHPIFKKYEALTSFIRASKNSSLREVFERNLLENIKKDFTQNSHYLKGEIDYSDDYLLAEIIKKTSPQLANEIIDFALNKESPKNFLLRYGYFVTAAAKICPQRATELVKAYSAENTHASVSMVRSLIGNLPSKAKKYINEGFSKLEDRFTTLEEDSLLDYESNADKTSNKTYPQTYLEVSELTSKNLPELQRKIAEGEFDNVAVVKIFNSSNPASQGEDSPVVTFLDSLLERKSLKKTALRHLSCSDNLQRDQVFLDRLKNAENQISSEFINHRNYWGIGELFDKARKNEIRKTRYLNQAFNQSGSNGSQPSKKIRIASGGLAKSMDAADSDGVKLTSITAGEILNGDSEILTRTSLIKRDISKNLDWEEYVPSKFVKIAGLNSLTNHEIAEVKNTNIANKSSCQFSQKITANKKFRLLSIHAAEEMLGIVGDVEGLSIERGDDDFFYATSTSDRVLTYVLQAPSHQSDKAAYAALPSDDPIKKIIDEYRDPAKGFALDANPANKTPAYQVENHQAWLDEVFEKRCGVCRHREAAVAYQLTKRGIASENFRTVLINNNHVVLEIKSANGKWIKADFGGGEALERDLGEEVVYAAGGISADQLPATVEKTLEELVVERDLLNLVAVVESDLVNLVAEEKEGFADTTQLSSAVKQEAKDSLKKMAKIFLESYALPVVEDAEILKSRIVESDKSKILVSTKKTQQHANYFLEQAVAQGREVFYIDHPSKIDLHRINLLISNDNQPALRKDGLLSNFLQNAATNSAKGYEEKPLLLINWDILSSKERVALNTIIDERRRISGVDIDASIQIIGLCENTPKDASFLSRHDLAIESKVNLPKKDLENSNPPKIIDLEGLTDWRRALFGKVILQKDGLIWQESDFVKALKKGENNFEIINLSPEAAQKLQYEIKQAQALGHFTYHGHKVPLPPVERSRNQRKLPAENPNPSSDLTITTNPNSFNFQKFQDPTQITIADNVTFDQAPSDCALINSYLFDALLCDKKIEKGTYQEEEGLIAKCAATTEKNLKLFISSDLSESQWYCLFNEAQKHQIKLQLHLAPQIKTPDIAKTDTFLADFEDVKNSKSRIFVSNDADATFKKNREEFGEDLFAVVDVEDCNYQDLIKKIAFDFDENGFRDFEEIESEFFTNLKNGKKIVLKGEFSKDLLQMLQPILTSEAGKNLTVIIEDKSCLQGAIYKPLKWLNQKDYQVENHAPKVAQTNFIPEDVSEIHGVTTSSKEKSDAFIERRKSDFSTALDSNSMLRLVGHSGVGKSRLLEEFEDPKHQDSHQIYHGLDDLESWANDKSGKRKILFLDESNINDCHFTIFSPLKKDPKNQVPKQLFYKGKFYDFDANHKVVFACNPVEYGGGRFEQKLFEDGEILAMTLRDFPANYIYEKILKESIYDELRGDIREESEISEVEFKEYCSDLIEKYQANNSKKKSDEAANEETVRELQENVLNFIEGEINSKKTSEIKSEIESENFISTHATKEVEDALNRSLNIRHYQRDGKFPSAAVGLNGILIEGDSGIGKSALITAILENKGITEKKFGEIAEEINSSSKQRYYKIDANLPLAQKREIIVRAFEEGNIVLIDELNSCIDDGLEKVLNAVLTGEHPDKKTDKEIKSGFMMISSVNDVGLGGRSTISPAIRHRSVEVKAKSLKEYSISDFTKIITSWINQENKKNPNFLDQDLVAESAADVAKNFTTCLKLKGAENLNLRMLKTNLGEILADQREVSAKRLEEKHGQLAESKEGLVNYAQFLTQKPSQNPRPSIFHQIFHSSKKSKIVPITSDPDPDSTTQPEHTKAKASSLFGRFTSKPTEKENKR